MSLQTLMTSDSTFENFVELTGMAMYALLSAYSSRRKFTT